MKLQQSFETLAQDAFASVATKYGYQIVDVSDSCVRYASCDSMILVRYDQRRSFEVGVDFSDLENGEPKRHIPFSLEEVFREFDVPDAERVGFHQSSDLSSVYEFLVKAAKNLDRYCSSILRGEPDAFASVNQRRSRESLAYTQQVQIDSVRERADAAWREKHYKEFIELFEKFENVLPVADKKKLDYAMKQTLSL